ncbi:hypothetical protein NC653_008029 [Populus alba x Populus x berolinensis]|uniref:Uncharacterized protein n=1 Tax=Populus alba x Populus x berolinensis TaxID=444605 RepID=A0AAD6W9G9_9ROSI|nr:hypothetical protein NC653_008029 [Populus alba x Populus x berolinensis]
MFAARDIKDFYPNQCPKIFPQPRSNSFHCNKGDQGNVRTKIQGKIST